MSRFPPMYLNNTENNVVSSILEEEASELKDATLSTQSNIFMNDQQKVKDYESWEYKSVLPPKSQNQSFNTDFTAQQISAQGNQKEKNQVQYTPNSKLSNINDTGLINSNESSHTDENLKKFDINDLKLEVDNLMSHVRGTAKGEKPLFNDRLNFQLQQNNSPTSAAQINSPTANEYEKNYNRGNSSTQSPFMFQQASDNQSQKRNSPAKVQNQFENSDMNVSVASLFSNKWQNYDINNSGSNIKSFENIQYSAPHVEFPDFKNRYSQSRSPYSKFSKQYYEEDEEKNDGPFVLPQAQFPEAPKVLQYKYSKRPDSSKRDLADLDGLRKENFKLKAEILKLEKRLQLEEEEHKKLISSLEKSERIRAEYRSRIEEQSH